ncbi:MAG: hypothetical protein DK304_000900 [Chloroflexi bacterium]|jgi:hypothetical protein|nr:MAG: hypothetical protein DK304_000900 [Chloroflexota bacterium]
MEIGIGILLGLLSIIVLGVPFLRNGKIDNDSGDIAKDLRTERLAIYQNIKVLENDFRLKHITENEYLDRLNDYRFQAADLLRKEDKVLEMDDLIEKAIAKHGKSQNDNAQ